MPKRVFVSFDYDYDKSLKDLLIGQAKNPDSPLEVDDWSIKEAPYGGKAKARAVGVAIELRVAQEEGIDYFLLNGYSSQTGKKPTTAQADDKLYHWTWPNLETPVGGGR
ncbi:hypothetical protein OG594_24545 [Streptomyces sp. NBC_01214]|uniref:hypothetical protein n=1 Tax=Streptomyces sp. NBC_01214 TaxID=2903777 RepID=UPI0022532F1F|nr:hypothetical protein [Streptomyces sp. NBC_01214]MCX4804743.1 hypothetical protein [Streptomyces sp. NBC_01214]